MAKKGEDMPIEEEVVSEEITPEGTEETAMETEVPETTMVNKLTVTNDELEGIQDVNEGDTVDITITASVVKKNEDGTVELEPVSYSMGEAPTPMEETPEGTEAPESIGGALTGEPA